MKPPSDTRKKILQTSVEIVNSRGARHLTIDAVAAETGLSKGGVLYHFSSKRALVEGLLNEVLDSFDSAMEERRSRKENAGRPLIGLIALTQKEQPPMIQSMLAIVAAAAEDRSLLHRSRENIDLLLRGIANDNADRQLATILFLAIEGLRFLDILGLLPAGFDQDDILDRIQLLAQDLPADPLFLGHA